MTRKSEPDDLGFTYEGEIGEERRIRVRELFRKKEKKPRPPGAIWRNVIASLATLILVSVYTTAATDRPPVEKLLISFAIVAIIALIAYRIEKSLYPSYFKSSRNSRHRTSLSEETDKDPISKLKADEPRDRRHSKPHDSLLRPPRRFRSKSYDDQI